MNLRLKTSPVRVAFTALILGFSVVSACGVELDSATSTVTPQPSTTSTTRPEPTLVRLASTSTAIPPTVVTPATSTITSVPPPTATIASPPTAQAVIDPTVVPVSTEPPVFSDVTGTWDTDYGTMRLVQNGSSVTGTYTTDGGVIIDASLSGNTLIGFWVEDASAADCGSPRDGRNYWGRISFEFDEDFVSFDGKWRWCDQRPTENWDGGRISGSTATHFIAIGDRPVRMTGGAVFHYSLEYWQCDADFSPLNQRSGFSQAQIVRNCITLNSSARPSKLGEVELLARRDWNVWIGGFRPAGTAKSWNEVNVSVSEIVYENTEATRIMPIFTGTAAEVEARWATIIDLARTYEWAEQSGFADGPIYTKWPKSMYKSLQTNSNTFIRQLVTGSGLTMTEIADSHPGRQVPSQNTDTFVGRPMSVFEEHTPWNQSGPAKPRPPGSPP